MCTNLPLPKRFLKSLSETFVRCKARYDASGCTGINLYFEDESRFGLLTVLRRMLTAKGIKAVAPFLHRFDTLYLFGAFSALNGHSCLVEMPHCNTYTFQAFIDHLAAQNPQEFKILILDNGAFHHAKSLAIPANMDFVFLPPYSPELNPAEKVWRYLKDRVSMIAFHSIEMLQQQLAAILKQTTTDRIMSICSNAFYINTFQGTFNV
jgi:transposase